MKSSGTSLGKTFGKLFALGAAVIAAAGIKDFLSGAIDEAREAQKVGAQTGAVLKSTGAIANVSAGQVERLAGALSAKIGVDDEAIQAGENLLLTFTNVRNEVGKGNDIFTQATRTVQDMAAAFGGDAVSNSKILGKALNDPVKGVSALTRVGVSFTEQQKEQIKTLVESGDVMGAQKVILKELAKQSEGSAEAQVTNADKARVAYGNLQEQMGTALLPVLDKLAGLFTDKIAPAISEFVTEMQDGTGAGGQFRDAVEDIVRIGEGVLSFFNGLPGPVKKFGIEIGIAALVVPKLTAAVAALKIDMGTAETRMAALGRAARMASGMAGMALLIDASQRGDTAVGKLETTLGGAALGFSLGGPWGAAIGAAAGAIKVWGDAAKRSQQAIRDSIQINKDYASSFDAVTGAVTKVTRQTMFGNLQNEGVIDISRAIGIPDAEMVRAAMGNMDSVERIAARVRELTGTAKQLAGPNSDLFFFNKQSAADFINGLRVSKQHLTQEQQAFLDALHASEGFKESLKGLPKKAQTEVKALGIAPAVKDVARLATKYKLTPKQINTVLKTTGGTTTLKQVQRVIDKLTEANRTKVEPDIKGGVGKSAKAAMGTAADGGRNVVEVLKRQLSKGKAEMPQLQPSLRGLLGGAAKTGRSGGIGIGSAVKTGFGSGFAGAALAWAAALRAAVAAAIAAGRAEAKAHSPSKETEALGKDLGLGLVLGLEKSSDKVGEAAEKLTKKVKEKLANLRDTLAGVKSDFASLVEPIASAFTGNLFEATNAKDFVASLMGTKGQLQGLIAAFKTLIGQGLDPKFLYSLFQSGNAGLILDLAKNPELAAQAGGLFKDVTDLSTQLGTSVAGATKEGQKLEAQTVRLEKKLDHLIDATKKVGEDVGRAVNDAASNGKRRAA